MPKTGVEPEWFINTRLHVYIAWFINTRLHVYIAWFEYMHASHLIGTHDRHLTFMQSYHLVIVRWPMQGRDIS